MAGIEGDAKWHVCVLIPARNEEALLPRCLDSVLAAAAGLRGSVSCDVVVTVDRSTDRTWEIAGRMLQGHGMVISTEAGIVGSARALAADAALERYNGLYKRCWLANTDADCVVPEDWLIQQLDLAENEIEAVAGTIDVDSFDEHQAIVADRFRKTYLIGADGTHAHVHGANLGVRADTYVRAGGWRNFASAEDHDLWRRVRQLDARTFSSSQIVVATSGRKVGRAPHGFAEALAAHNETAA